MRSGAGKRCQTEKDVARLVPTARSAPLALALPSSPQYVLISVSDGSGNKKVVVRGYNGCEYHGEPEGWMKIGGGRLHSPRPPFPSPSLLPLALPTVRTSLAPPMPFQL